MSKMYWNETFLEIYPDLIGFKNDYETIGTNFHPSINLTDEQLSTIYYLLVSRYGSDPIANRTLTIFKTKLFALIYSYAPIFLKKREIQDKLRSLTEDELRLGSKQIYNHAFNPSNQPSTASLEELDYINDQNTATNKKGKTDAYMVLWSMLSSNEVEDFLRKFRVLFQIVVDRQLPWWYDYEEGE